MAGRSPANRLAKPADWSDSTAFAVSPLFVVLLGIFFCNIFIASIPLSFSDDPGAFYWFCFWLTVASACLLTLAWITLTAGLDLWRLKNWIGFLFSSDSCRKMLGAAFCTFGGFFLVYLQRPTIQQSFAARLATLKFSEVFCCAELLTRVHSQLPVRFSDATGYFRRWSKKER